MPAERTPFFCGSFPVATAAQTASADVGWMRRQMHHRAGIEDPAEIRQPAFGGGAGDEIERAGIDGDDDDARLPLGGRESIATSSGRASSSAVVPRPRTRQRDATEEPATTSTQNSAHAHRASVPDARAARASSTKARRRAPACPPRCDRRHRSRRRAPARTSCRFAHINAAPPRGGTRRARPAR